MTTLVNNLQKMTIFAGFSEQEITSIMRRVPYTVSTYRAGYTIARAGDELNDILLLLNGKMHASLEHEGKDILVDVIDYPYILAPACMYTTEGRYPVTMTTDTPCTLMWVDGQAFKDELQRNEKLMMNFIRVLSDRIEFLTQRVHEFSLQPLRERVLSYLYKHEDGVKELELMAKLMGVARQSLSRVITELKKDKLVHRSLDGLELIKRDDSFHRPGYHPKRTM